MQIQIKLLLILICAFIPTMSEADPAGMWYRPVGQISSTQLPIGQWAGHVSFQNVYCATFPSSVLAQRVDQAFFNSKSVFWMSVSYVDNTVASIAVSTIPENQSPEYAIEQILLNERNLETVLSKEGGNYKVEEVQTAWGHAINVKATNLALMSQYGPFPLTRVVTIPTNPSASIASKSVHRLFVRGHDRFEIAIMRTSILTANSAQEKVAEVELMSMLDQLTNDLQFCTSQMALNRLNPLGQQ